MSLRPWFWLGVALLLLGGSGCSRPFWRTQADFDAYNLLLEKMADARWNVPRLTLESDPRARIYDPYDLDFEPLPPDDAAANRYMHWVDGMRGYQSWHRFGQQMTVENPQWLAQFDLKSEDFEVDWIDPEEGDDKKNRRPHIVPTLNNLTLEQALELANINSREYQLQLENTYISALALTFARFQFNVRYLGLNGLQPTSALSYITQPSTLDTLNYNKRFGVSQLLPSGGQWIAEIANNTLWLFSTPGQTESASVLTYSLVQPLLAGGGRKVVLENLTLTERQLLYNMRVLARFRKIFFANGVGFDGQSGGFLGLMQQTQQVENLRSNLREFRLQIEKLRAINTNPNQTVQEKLAVWPEGLVIPADLADHLSYDAANRILEWRGTFTLEDEEALIALSDDAAFQRVILKIAGRYRLEILTKDLAQVLTTAATVQNNLRSAEASLLDNIDDYKLFMGLPTDFQITLDRSMLKPFELIDPRLNRLEDRLLQTVKTRFADGAELTQPQLERIILVLQSLGDALDREGLELVKQDLQRELENRPKRLKSLPTEADRQQVLKNIERDRILFQRNQEQLEFLGVVLTELQKLLRSTELPLTLPENEPLPELDPAEYSNLIEYNKLDQMPMPTQGEALDMLTSVRENYMQVLQGLKVIQVGSRTELITLQDFDMTLEDCVAIAVENRLDLMNARAQVMDARRNLEVVANKMEGVLNVVTRGDIRNSGGTDPFDFRADESTFQFGVQFTAPLDQVLVRNNYRAALINYQQVRRAYMQLEDTIKRDVRFEWRQLQLNKANFETARQNIRFAAIQYDVTNETAYQPSNSGEVNLPQPGGRVAARGGNTGLDLLNALNGILNAQNNLIGFWVTYERNRINIYKDMDIMEIDERGLWLDPAYQPQPPATTVPPDTSEPADVIPPAPAVDRGRDTGLSGSDQAFDEAVEKALLLSDPDGTDAAGGADRVGVSRLTEREVRRPVPRRRIFSAVE